MTGGNLLPLALLKRKAVVYVRQSTAQQVHANLESQRRQYELVDLARRWGFHNVEVIDEDLGRSASGAVERPGFERLVDDLCTGHVGAVLCLEASRLSRNGPDWQRLLELCGQVDARVIDMAVRCRWCTRTRLPSTLAPPCIMTAVRADRAPEPVRSFGTFTADLHQLVDWFTECGVETVVMESTSVYWIPVFELLDARGFTVFLVNARDAKHVPGRKTDVSDAQWLQRLHSFGLLRASFRPKGQIAELRAYVRQRERLLEYAASHIQHMQKALTEMNLHLHHVVADITGATGLRIIRAILAGERDPEALACLRHYSCHSSAETIAKALTGSYRAEHLFALEQALALYDAYHEKASACDARIEAVLKELSIHRGHGHGSAPRASRRRNRTDQANALGCSDNLIIEPEHDGSELDEAEEVGGDFVVAGCDTPPLFELGEESLDAPAVFVGDLVVAMLVFAMAPWRDDRFTALVEDHIMQSIGIVSAVGDHLARRNPFDQTAGRCHVVLLTGADLKADRQAECIYDGMKLGAEPATRATESLGFRSPLI